jgi:hypothetical protein
MQVLGRFLFIASLFVFFIFPASAFTPQPGTDDPPSFYSCFYLGNIVDDAVSIPDSAEVNEVTFHDGRAIQLYAMGKLAEGHSKNYIEQHLGKISDFARAIPNISEAGAEPDWYDGRVASLTGVLFCADDDTNGDGLSDTIPRATCPMGFSSLFPEGSVIERIKPYLQPCCVLSGGIPEEEVDYFPCALP